MTTMLKRSAMVGGLLFAATLCMGIVYIDNVKHYFYQSGGMVQMWVNTNFVFHVNTNNGQVGWGYTNLFGYSMVINGKNAPTNTTGNGINNSADGSIALVSGRGGGTFATTSASGGTAGALEFYGGTGGRAPLATTNATGGGGGPFSAIAGDGGGGSMVATNSATGGAGGAVSFLSGGGGTPSGTAPTNSVGGSGGDVNFTAGPGASPSVGWARKGGNAGNVFFNGANGGSSQRTNGGNGSTITGQAGNAGSAGTGGDAGIAGNVNWTAGNGAAGNTPGTNSNGGNIFLRGGTPGSGAVPGNVVVGRIAAGTGNGGGLVVGISNSAVLTNLMFVRTNLDFGSIAAQTSGDIPVLAVTGRTNAIVNVASPASAIVASCMYSGWMSNGVVFVRFNNYSAAPIDPGISDFEVEVKAYR